MIDYQALASLTINEDVSHGRVVKYDFEKLPEPVKNKLYKEMADELGCDVETAKKRIGAMLVGDRASAYDGSDNDKFSISGNDPIDGIIMRELEHYDKTIEESIKDSENIVELYNALISAKFDKAKEMAETLIKMKDEFESKEHKTREDEDKYDKDRNAIITAAKHQGLLIPLDMIAKLLADELDFKEHGMTDADIKKYICDAAYGEIKDPEEVKKIINARIHFNNACTATLKSMLQENYNILGLSKDEALTVSGKLASPDQHQQHKGIKDAKEIISKNADKFKVGKCSYDFRQLGLGCVFMTEKNVGRVGKDVSVDRLVPLLTKYDAIVIGHGYSSNERLEEYDKKEREKLDDQFKKDKAEKERELEKYSNESKKLRDEIHKLYDSMPWDSYYETDACKQLEKLADDALANGDFDKCREYRDEKWRQYHEFDKLKREERDKIQKHIDELREAEDEVSKNEYEASSKIRAELIKAEREMEDKHDADVKRIYRSLDKRGLTRWQIQPIKTLHGGPFEDVNDLVHQLIKEGFKNIMMISCNPGGHQLDKDIVNNHDVHVHHATASLLSESATDTVDENDIMLIESAINSIEYNIKSTEDDLIAVCEASDISYDLVDFDECVADYYEFMESTKNMTLTEGVLSTAWETLLKLIKKAISFLVALFKKMLELIGKVLGKIKEFFKKVFGSDKGSRNFSKPVSFGSIMLENASLKTIKAKSWGEMQSLIVTSCDKISKEINRLEREQVGNMKELERKAENEVKHVNESVNVGMNKLCALIV